MNAIYPARYKDRFGEEQTTIHNDGKTLTMIVRGVEFEGKSFDGLDHNGKVDPAQLSSFNLWHDSLCECVIETDIPIPVATPDGLMEVILKVELEIRNPALKEDDCLKLRLKLGAQHFSSTGTSGWFEDEMLDLQRQLPSGTVMQACINCAFSDYSVYGHMLFGDMMCFRGSMGAYLAVVTKADYMKVGETDCVQETYLCLEFEPRVPGTGYRG